MEYLENSAVPEHYKDLQKVENQFINYIFDKNTISKANVNLIEIIEVLSKFLESSSFGDFHNRIKILKSFELFIHRVSIQDDNKKMNLIYGIHNLQIYYSQFSSQIANTMECMRKPIEKKLKEFVKIESYNKDLSYFSMRNNISRVHRNLNKFVKEYENQLNTKISSVFKPEEISLTVFESKLELINQVSIVNFIVPAGSNTYSSNVHPKNTALLLLKIDHLVVSSKKVVEAIITSAKYPSYIDQFQSLFDDQIENYQYLHELKVIFLFVVTSNAIAHR